MLQRYDCRQTGAFIDRDQAGLFISCGDCGWNHRMSHRGAMFWEAEASLRSHYANAHDKPDLEFLFEDVA